MSVFPNEIIQRLKTARVAAGFSLERVDHAVPLAKALWEGGIEAIELTLRTPASLEGVFAICAEVPEMLVGVGTILTPELVSQVKSAGASFGVAPGLNPRVIQVAQKIGLPFAPGIATPSDIEAAIEMDCRFVKFFPANALGGVPYLRSMSAPYRHLGMEYFPLGGINLGNMLDYLREPDVVAVGGSWIVQHQIVADEDWAGIAASAQEVTNKLSEVSTRV